MTVETHYSRATSSGKERYDTWRPVPPGVTISRRGCGGTFGCVVLKHGKRKILSNNHVLALMNEGKIGDDVFQPYTGDSIATLESYVSVKLPPGVNKVDCAIASPNEEDSIVPGIIIDGDYEPNIIPEGIMDAYVGQRVKKSGARSGYTTGSVISVGSDLILTHSKADYRFEDIILMSSMVSPGDSGSLLMDEDTNKAVGLIFAGSDVISAACKIQNVLAELKCELYTVAKITIGSNPRGAKIYIDGKPIGE